ncbi:MAG TPA: cytochrome c [Gammaproteobacteria bacterium]|nr:cytochrome c [Gammaproteobacteria bacterium]
MQMKKAIAAIAGLMLLVTGAGAFAQGDAAAGKEKSAPCAACHGADGNSQDPNFPLLAGQHADYMVKALEDYKSGERKNPIMAGFAAGLSKQDREDLAAFFASQKGPLTVIKFTQ